MTEHGKGNETIYGIVSLVLGVISLMLFCTCINWVTGVIAIVFGIIQLVKNQERGPAVAGIVTAGLSLLLALILYGCLAAGMDDAGMDYDEFYREYFRDYGGSDDYGDSYHYYDDYNYDDEYNYDDDEYDYYDYYDDFYDYYNYGEGGQEFL